VSTPADWRDTPLRGRLLVEASAGTGKTWTMAALYLRLLLDGIDGAAADDGQRHRALAPERIVVATYTEAAAQELGERLRARVTQALRLAEIDAPALDASDPVQAWLGERWADPAARTADAQRLRRALASFDRAPIGTLHGLCLRLLREHPLDGGLGFSPPAIGDGRRVHEAIARDLLRRIGAGAAPPAAIDLPASATRFAALVEAVGFVLQPGAAVAPAPDDDAIRALADAPTRAALATLADPAHYTRATAKALRQAAALHAFLDDPTRPAPAAIDALCDGRGINSWVREPAATVLQAGAFQQAMARMQQALAQRDSKDRAFWAWWTPELRRWRDLRSAESGELGFDPLIERVAQRMVAPGSALPDAAFTRWPVALVDEFQDTDGTQYALLDRWYRDADGNPRGLLATVGDPKQAIYGFRGGDIHAYLAARGQADTTLRLAVNQRSSSAYVKACNALFDGPRALLSADAAHPIRYAPVLAAGRADAQQLHERGAAVERPLVIHQHRHGDWNAIARPKALEACADLVVDLLEAGRFRFGASGRALAPGDIAVLLRTNGEIDDLRRALQRRGVPCAGQSRQQVFDSAAARDLLLVLHAVLHPGDVAGLRAALLTPLFRVPAAALPVLDADGRLDAWRERFIGWRLRWTREGVLAVVLAVLDAAGPALADDREGERIATDLRHLGELLADREGEGHTPSALLEALRAHRRGDDDGETGGDERSLRLESDVRRVRLMTLHASKGLEFPVVVLPTLWAHEARRSARALLPAGADGRREVVFEADTLKALRGEAQDERFRLLYVALTRAVQACHLFVLPEDRPAAKNANGPKTDPERSALDALLARWPAGERHRAEGIDWREHWPLPSATHFDAGAHAGADDTADADADVDADRRAPSPAPGPFVLPTRWSFSRLAGGHDRRSVEATAADDETPTAAAISARAATDAASPIDEGAIDPAIDAALAGLAEVRGTAFGNALHELLEGVAPGRRFSDDVGAVQAALARHAVRSDATAPTPMPLLAARVAAMLDRALEAPLVIDARAPPLRLRELPASRRVAELAFHFALRDASLRALRAACERHGEPALVPPGGIDRLDGWMEGSIDLVFEHGGRAHVLDWKGNDLANAAAATPQALVGLMDQHHYRFQALLYSVALHRLLRQRLGASYRIGEHLGAPVYVFLRAAGLAPGLGCWTQHFPETLIEAVDAALAGTAMGVPE
jgi:exodeoxyribonuclease V beta subunit